MEKVGGRRNIPTNRCIGGIREDYCQSVYSGQKCKISECTRDVCRSDRMAERKSNGTEKIEEAVQKKIVIGKRDNDKKIEPISEEEKKKVRF